MDEGRLRSLEHPLPAGMRDLLPDEAESRRALARTLLDRFALHGYRVVTPPAFELADVVERGLGAAAASDAMRFVEPQSGDVAVLHPDLTPQIARIVATRLRDHVPPLRLAYEGTVIRRRAGRAKKHRQIPQVGVELCGAADGAADVELLELAALALREAGLARFVVDVSDAGIVRALLADVDDASRERVTQALAKKDEARLADAARDLPDPVRAAVVALPRLHGGRDALVEATRVLAATPASVASTRLLALFDAATARGLGAHLTADAGEVRGFAYYTGAIFSIYADGPGEPIGAGGRYDELLSRFGAPMPATGFAIDLDALAWARRGAGVERPSVAGVVVVGADDDPRLAELRAKNIAAVTAPSRASAIAYAKAWRFACVLDGTALLDAREPDAAPGQVDAKRPADDVARMLDSWSRGD